VVIGMCEELGPFLQSISERIWGIGAREGLSGRKNKINKGSP
jgi:hypothetical protein